MPITIDISPGELLDRLTIIELKVNAFKYNPEKLQPLEQEYRKLRQQRASLQGLSTGEGVWALEHSLRHLNRRLWQLEDDVRRLDPDRQAGDFIQAARGIFHFNLQRAAVKQKINQMLSHPETDFKTHTLPVIE